MNNNIHELRTDALLWKANLLKSKAGDNIAKKAEAIEVICKTLSLVKNDIIRDNYTSVVAKSYKEKIKFFTDRVSQNLKHNANNEDDEEVVETNYKFPSFFEDKNINEMHKLGFTQTYEEGSIQKTGIHFLTKDGAVSVSNCKIEPLFHIVSPDINQNKKIFVFKNAFETAALDVEAAATLSVERFSAIINAKNNFMFHGNSMQLKRIMEHLGYMIPRCEEVKILGWQPEGFFAYTDKFVSNGELVELNEYGIGKHNDRMYYSPSQSILYKNNRSDDNIYESLKYMNYHQSPINFEKWSKLMVDAYGMNGVYGVSYVFIACFRDLVLRIDGVCPHFYVWGAPGSGKSKMMESIASLFFCEKRSFAANSGTDFSLSRFLEIFRNTFHFINELDDQDIKPQWLQWFKGAYDNEGRQRGKGGSKNMTETMNVNSALGFAGQKIVNSDDNALPMRCIIRNFKVHEEGKDRPAEQMKAYNTIKEMESNGGFNSLLVDIMAMREDFKQDYHNEFSKIFVATQREIRDLNLRWNERIGRNYCYLLAGVKIATRHFALPFKYEDLYADVVQQIHQITKMITGTDATSEFWRIVMSLVDQNKIVSGWHFKTEVKYGTFKLYNKEVLLTQATRVLFIRLSHIHTLYKLAYRSETGKEGMNSSSLISYLENRPYYLGTMQNVRFTGKDPHTGIEKSQPTSCVVFNYELMEQLGIELETDLATTRNNTPSNGTMDAFLSPTEREHGPFE